MPSPSQRKDILDTLLSEVHHSLNDQQIKDLATVTHGFVGADLAGLCNEAAFICQRRYASLVLPSYMMGATSEIMGIIPDSGEEKHMKVNFEDFQKARMKIRPSAMREVWLMS